MTQGLSRRNFGKQSASFITPIVLAGAAPWLRPARASAAGRKLRVGQVGTMHGHSDGKMLAVRQASDQFEVVGVVEQDAQQRQRAQSRPAYANLPWMSLEQLLNQSALDLVLVETDIDQLLPVAEACLQADLHVHLDKPAGTSLAHLERIHHLARTKNKLIQMGYMFRSNPAFQFVYRAFQSGWLGDIFEVDAVMSKKLADEERPPLARYRGGAMFELGCHLIDFVVRLLGKPDRITPYNLNSLAGIDELRDNCLAVFQYPRATAAIRSSLIEIDGNARRQLVVCGTQGTIAIKPLEPPQLTLTLDRPQGDFRKGTQQVELPRSGGRYEQELISLASAIRGERDFEYSLEHDLLVQTCVLQASEMV